jgi:hypothetical protein
MTARKKSSRPEPPPVAEAPKNPCDSDRSFLDALVGAMRSPPSSAELNFDEDAVASKPRASGPPRLTRRRFALLLEPCPPPSWALDPSLLPKRPPTASVPP